MWKNMKFPFNFFSKKGNARSCMKKETQKNKKTFQHLLIGWCQGNMEKNLYSDYSVFVFSEWKKLKYRKKAKKRSVKAKTMDEFKRNKQVIVTLANFRNEKTKTKQKYISAIPILMKQLDFAILTFSFLFFLFLLFCLSDWQFQMDWILLNSLSQVISFQIRCLKRFSLVVWMVTFFLCVSFDVWRNDDNDKHHYYWLSIFIIIDLDIDDCIVNIFR
mgnify:CR=1 FL=1